MIRILGPLGDAGRDRHGLTRLNNARYLFEEGDARQFANFSHNYPLSRPIVHTLVTLFPLYSGRMGGFGPTHIQNLSHRHLIDIGPPAVYTAR